MPAWAVQLPTLGMSLDQALCFATNPRALLVRIPANEQMGTAEDPSMARSAHGTVRGRRLRLAEGADRHRHPPSPERRCHMARLRRLLLTLAVAALLLVGTASAALAGLTTTGVD